MERTLPNSQIGALVSMGGKEHISVSRSQIGFALFGPYETLPAGDFEVEFSFSLSPDGGTDPDDIFCKLDVAAGIGTQILVRRDVTYAEMGQGPDAKIVLSFSISQETTHLEFRVWSLGKSDFAVAVERPVKNVGKGGGGRKYGAEPTGFCADHALTLRDLEAKGARIERRADSASISLGGVNVVARHREDFQLISEVLVFNTYKILPLRDSIVVDVGMNIGLATAFFARQAWAKKVYGYEPFRDPFQRSGETFDSNSDLKHKIFPVNCGLSDRNETVSVHYSPDSTIAMGVRGIDKGPVQQLQILDAGKIFQSVCAEAEEAKLGVVVKLDCEGSEFPIMKRLAEKSLIGRIDAFMIEWHKVWSPDVSLKDLTDPLRANGFVIFDHTVDSDLFAGMVYAVRTR